MNNRRSDAQRNIEVDTEAVAVVAVVAARLLVCRGRVLVYLSRPLLEHRQLADR